MKRHPFDAVSFTFGLLLLAAGVAAAVGPFVPVVRLQTAWPIVVIVLGAVLVASGARSRGKPSDVLPAGGPLHDDEVVPAGARSDDEPGEH